MTLIYDLQKKGKKRKRKKKKKEKKAKEGSKTSYRWMCSYVYDV
jgi:hypothetical protein